VVHIQGNTNITGFGTVVWRWNQSCNVEKRGYHKAFPNFQTL